MPVMNYLFSTRNDMEIIDHLTLREHVATAVARAAEG
jgi:hypothetical protein